MNWRHSLHFAHLVQLRVRKAQAIVLFRPLYFAWQASLSEVESHKLSINGCSCGSAVAVVDDCRLGICFDLAWQITPTVCNQADHHLRAAAAMTKPGQDQKRRAKVCGKADLVAIVPLRWPRCSTVPGGSDSLKRGDSITLHEIQTRILNLT